MMHLRKLAMPAVIVGILALIAGCAGSGDPHDPGFFTGVGDLSSGTYDQRLQNRRQELNDLGAMRQDLEGKADSIMKSQVEIRAGLNQAEMELAQMQTDLSSLNSQLEGSLLNAKFSEQQRADLMQEIVRLGRQVELVRRAPVASPTDTQKELAALKERYAVLSRALAAALSR